MKYNCKVMEDIYPNYIDEICSEDSKLLVDQHLMECDRCREIINNMRKKIEPNIEVDIEDDLAKKIINKVVTKKYFVVGCLVFLLLATGAYRFFYLFSEVLSLTPENALTKLWYVSENAEIIHKEKTEKGMLIVYEDGIQFGAVIARRPLGIFWEAKGGSYGHDVTIGRPFAVTGTHIYNKGIYTTTRVIKTNDPNIKYVVFDKNHLSPNQNSLELEGILEDDRYFIVEIHDGYGYYVDSSTQQESFYEIGFITTKGEYIHKSDYRLIRGDTRD